MDIGTQDTHINVSKGGAIISVSRSYKMWISILNVHWILIIHYQYTTFINIK